MRSPMSAACRGASQMNDQIVSLVIIRQQKTKIATSASQPAHSVSCQKARGGARRVYR